MKRGEVWDAELSPTHGREQDGKRPVLIISKDAYLACGFELIVVVPITKTNLGWPTRVPISPPEGGVSVPSFAIAEQPRTISTARLTSKRGNVSQGTLSQVLRIVQDILGP